MNGQDKFAENSKSKVRIRVLKDKCISAATCIIEAPKTFDLDDESIAFVLEKDWDEAVQIVMAAKSCPTRAIIVEDLQGNQLWPK